MCSYENDNNNLKFDTVKVRTNINYLISKDIEFSQKYENGLLIGEYYTSTKNIPYNVYIGLSYNSQSLTMEFSSKVLLDNYPKLITLTTFRQCLENINKLGICSIDVDAIANDCYFSAIDITNDIDHELTDNVLNSLNLCVNNYRRYKWEHYKDGIQYTKDVVTKSCQESILIYDKEKEISLSKNTKFLSLLENSQNVIDYFKGKTRIEMTLNTPKKICDLLNIENTHISNIFKSEVNPLLAQFNKIFGAGEVENKHYITNYEDYSMQVIIQKHKGNLQKIEQEMKDLNVYSSNSRTGLSKRMKKMKQLHTRICNKTHNSTHILTEIRQKLSGKQGFC